MIDPVRRQPLQPLRLLRPHNAPTISSGTAPNSVAVGDGRVVGESVIGQLAVVLVESAGAVGVVVPPRWRR
jgi:hypothetical protein